MKSKLFCLLFIALLSTSISKAQEQPMLGEIRIFAGNFAPRGWAFCDGQLLDISQNTALYSLLGTTYGGDGRSTFGVPDLRGRAPIHEGRGPGLSYYPLGSHGGTETNVLNSQQMPSHSHQATGTITASNTNGTTNNPKDNVLAVAKTNVTRTSIVDSNVYSTIANTTMASGGVNVAIGNTGNNQPVNNLSPFLTLNFIIATDGYYPSRN